MCLLKRDDQENTCAHEECRNYYVRSKQTCLKTSLGDQNEANVLDFLQKKIKKEGVSQEKDTQSLLKDQVQNSALFGLNPMILSQMMANQPKQEFLMPSPFFPMLGQYNMPQNLNISFQELTNSSLGMQNMNLSAMNLNQLIKMKNQNSISGSMKPEATEADQQTDSSTRDFQNKLFNLVSTQNKILNELKEKHDVLEEALRTLTTEVSSLKHSITSIALPLSSQPNPAFPSKFVGNASENINTDMLLSYLYGPNPDFQYQLVLKKNLDLPLYRERNFKFSVLLVDKKGNLVENTNRITLSLGIYSSESPPKYIDTNTAGNKILKGFTEKDLVYGSASFEKIQIREVTSHFRNGWIFFVVYPKINSGGNMITMNGNANFISCQKIRPLILEKVIVKAKKTKEKESSVDADENGRDDVTQTKEEDISTSNN